MNLLGVYSVIFEDKNNVMNFEDKNRVENDKVSKKKLNKTYNG